MVATFNLCAEDYHYLVEVNGEVIRVETAWEACCLRAGEFPLYSATPSDSRRHFCRRVLDNPAGFVQGFAWVTRQGDTCPESTFHDSERGACSPAVGYKDSGAKHCGTLGNPITIGTGNKYESSIDYVGANQFPLSAVRHYNSDSSRWNFFPKISVNSIESPNSVLLRRPDGQVLEFDRNPDDVYTSRPDVLLSLERLVSQFGSTEGWQVVTQDDTREVYDRYGRINSITTRAGITHRYSHELTTISVTHDFGPVLTYHRTPVPDGKITGFTAPNAEQYLYKGLRKLRR